MTPYTKHRLRQLPRRLGPDSFARVLAWAASIGAWRLRYSPTTSEVVAIVWNGRAPFHGVACGARLECGGACVLESEHRAPCECGGDLPGQPGTCPA